MPREEAAWPQEGGWIKQAPWGWGLLLPQAGREFAVCTPELSWGSQDTWSCLARGSPGFLPCFLPCPSQWLRDWTQLGGYTHGLGI